MDAGPTFEVIQPAAPPVPILVHVPHASTTIPAEVRRDLLLDDDALAEEVLRLTDHRTDVLSTGTGELGATRFINLRSRLVVDPERFPDDGEAMLEVGMGPVYTRGHRRQRIRDLTDTDRGALLARYFHPYASAVAAEVTRQIDVHGTCTIVDVHSYPSRRLPYELGHGPRPALCIGVDEHHAPPWLVDIVRARADAHHLEVAVNTPFAGAYIPLDRYGTDDRVAAVMLEIRRDTYLDEETATPHAGEGNVSAFVASVVAAIAAEVAGAS